jgi:hypothetical protein
MVPSRSLEDFPQTANGTATLPHRIRIEKESHTEKSRLVGFVELHYYTSTAYREVTTR